MSNQPDPPNHDPKPAKPDDATASHGVTEQFGATKPYSSGTAGYAASGQPDASIATEEESEKP
jgi:hypothetical protein